VVRASRQRALLLFKMATLENTFKKGKAFEGILIVVAFYFFVIVKQFFATARHLIATLNDLLQTSQVFFFFQVPPQKKACKIIQAITGIMYKKYNSTNLGMESFPAPFFIISVA